MKPLKLIPKEISHTLINLIYCVIYCKNLFKINIFSNVLTKDSNLFQIYSEKRYTFHIEIINGQLNIFPDPKRTCWAVAVWQKHSWFSNFESSEEEWKITMCVTEPENKYVLRDKGLIKDIDPENGAVSLRSYCISKKRDCLDV